MKKQRSIRRSLVVAALIGGLVAVVVLGPGGLMAQKPEVITEVTNPDFEGGFYGPVGQSVANGWAFYFAGGEPTFDGEYTTVHSGGWAQKISGHAPFGAGLAQALTVKPGASYRVTVYYHLYSPGDGQASLGVQDGTAPAQWVGGGEVGVWRPLSQTLTVTSDQLILYLHAHNGTGLNTNVYFDDVTVTELDQPVPPPPEVITEVTNPDFEGGFYGPVGQSVANGWAFYVAGGEPTFDGEYTTVHSGGWAQKISGHAPFEAGLAQALTVKPGAIYRVTVYYHLYPPGDGQASLGVQDGTALAQWVAGGESGVWRLLSQTLTVTSDQLILYLHAHNGTGLNTNVYFDDVTVTELDQPVPPPPEVITEVTNPDFEGGFYGPVGQSVANGWAFYPAGGEATFDGEYTTVHSGGWAQKISGYAPFEAGLAQALTVKPDASYRVTVYYHLYPPGDGQASLGVQDGTAPAQWVGGGEVGVWRPLSQTLTVASDQLILYLHAHNGTGLNTNVYFDDVTVTELGQP